METYSRAQEDKALPLHPDADRNCPNCDGKGIHWHACGHPGCYEPCSCVYKKLRLRELYKQVVDECYKSGDYKLLLTSKEMKKEVEDRYAHERL